MEINALKFSNLFSAGRMMILGISDMPIHKWKFVRLIKLFPPQIGQSRSHDNSDRISL